MSTPASADGTAALARRPRRVDVRADILAAATRAFLTQGYRHTNLAVLAAEAGYSKGAVYSNFGGKPELFGEVMNSRASGFTDDALRQFDLIFSVDDPERSASSLAVELGRSLRRDADWPVLLEEFRGLAAENVRIRQIYTEWRTRQRHRLAEQIAERRRASGRTEPIDLQAAANLLMVLVNTLALEERAAPEATTPEVTSGTLELALRSVMA